MKELERGLKRLPREEREEALLYYREYFDDAGVERETEALEELGDAKTTAAQILKEVAIKRLEEPKKAAKRGLSTIWIVILALCAAPIGLPVLLITIVAGLLLVICVFLVFLLLLFAGILSAAVGVMSVAVGFFFLPIQTVNGIFILGTGLAETGVGMFLILGGCLSCRYIFAGMAGSVSKLLAGGKK